MVGHVGPWEYVCSVIAPLGHFVHGSAAGVAQAQHSGGLVEALSRRVVPCAAQHLKMGVVLHVHQGGGAAGYAQAQEGRLQVGVGDVIGGDVPPDVVDGDQRHSQPEGGGLGEGHPHQQGPDQAGGVSDRYGVNVRLGNARLPEGLVRQAGDGLHMLAGGNFRHHAAINGVHVRRGGDDGGQHRPAVLNDGGGSLIAGGFKG